MLKWNAALIVRFALGLLLLTRAIVAQTTDATNVQQLLYEVIDRCSPAVVEIQRRGAVFSGVIVSPKGYVLTAGHTVVPGNRYTVALPDGRRLPGQALGASEQMRGERIDCGLIRIMDSWDLPFVPMGDSSHLVAGQLCLSVSYPGGQRPAGQPLVRLGAVQRPPRPGRMLQSSALMEPGDSGGPLIDLSGKVIAIHSRIGMRTEQNYDVPINTFKTYWDALNVVHQFSAADGQIVPKLGFVGQDNPDGNGIAILSVADGSIAQLLGLQPADVLMSIQDQNLSGMRDLHPYLLSAIESQSEQVALAVRRGQEVKQYILPSDRFTLPVAERIPGLDEGSSASTLSSGSVPGSDIPFDKIRAELSRKLSDTCCLVTSHVQGRTETATATRIAHSDFLVSKSSLVGLVPFVGEGDEIEELTIVARDADWDLVLLKASQENSAGINLPSVPQPSPNRGSRVRSGLMAYTPTPKSEGFVSIVGGSLFASAREESRGYLGVVLRDEEPRGVVLVEVDEGAAMRAGLRPGDIILAINQQSIRNRQEILRLLQSLDPNMMVNAKILRDSQQFEVAITLGSRPNMSDHAADMMDKSLRRDGFASVFCHDATLTPERCGGPVFDLDGNWLGLNISRYSRVRTFAIPADAVAEFIQRNQGL